ncbi:AmpG family muropeptide MFS transporter [Acidocella facilis]|uniref:AmpG family muropeptide MFS transporter n=2 Tax=Acidocella TaxID=50709 RepID=UPI00047CA42D|nr:MFS transporter [Acidocella facilis]
MSGQAGRGSFSRPDFGRLGIMAVLGFSSGLPWALSGPTLRYWMSGEHVPLGMIGLTANIGLAYLLKFVWAPFFDEAKPFFFGRRRGWLIPVQIALALAIAALALSDPGQDIWLTLGLGALVAFLSASQDIIIDAWRIEAFAPNLQGAALACEVWGWRVAYQVSNAGVIALSIGLGWHGAFGLMAVLALLGPLAVLFAPEPQVAREAHPAGLASRFTQAVREPLQEFLGRRGIAVIIGFIVLFRLGGALGGTMLAPYYTALGFDRAHIAVANGPLSLVCGIAGTGLGGLLVMRIGVGRALLFTALLQVAALCLYPVLGLYPHLPYILLIISAVEAFTDAFSDTAFLSYLSGLCHPEHTATQYALLSSLAPLALHTIAGASGFLAARTGLVSFFVICAFAALPGIALLLVILRLYPPKETRLKAV